MKALVYTGTQLTEFREEQDPVSGPGQCIVDISHCGICGSDMHAWHGLDERRIPPLILGHEAAGVVRDGKLAGKRVVINPLMACGTCDACGSGNEHLCANRELIGMRVPGAFAESVAINEENLSILPDDLAFVDAALTEPLAVSVRTAELALARLEKPVDQAKFIVLGGGAIGLLAAKALEIRGARNIAIAETNPHRANMLAQSLSAIPYNPISAQPPFDNVDVIIDAVGSGATRKASSHLVRPGGTIVHVGLQDSAEGLDTRRITLQEISFVGAYCYTKKDFATALDYLHRGLVKRDNWSEIRPLGEGGNGFQDIHDGKALPKIILEI